MGLTFLVSETYAVCTPESAEYGEYAEMGFEFQDVEYTFRELYDYIRSEGYTLEGDDLCVHPYTTDYATCAEETKRLHIEPRSKREVRYCNILINMIKSIQ